MFHGHKFVKIQGDWVFDLTEYVGYHVELDNKGNVQQYLRKYKIHASQLTVFKDQGVPQCIIDKQLEIIRKYTQ